MKNRYYNSRRNEYLELAKQALALGASLEMIFVGGIVDEAKTAAQDCTDPDGNCRASGPFYGPDGYHSPRCVEMGEMGDAAWHVFDRLHRLWVSGNLVGLAPNGQPKLTRAMIRHLAPCPECRAKVDEFCKHVKTHPGQYRQDFDGSDRLRSHAGRMRAAQRVWHEKNGTLEVVK